MFNHLNKLFTPVLVAAAFLAFAAPAWAAPGDLDPTFDGDGMTTTFLERSGGASAVALQADGKMVVAGDRQASSVEGTGFDFTVMRYNTDGSLDTAFGNQGRVTTSFGNEDRAFDVAIQPDGKIVVVGLVDTGTSDAFGLARYTADGGLDTSFSSDGKVIVNLGVSSEARAVSLQPDGKIVVAGSSGPFTYSGGQNDFALARFTANGTLDTSFDADGMVVTDFGSLTDEAQALTIQENGKIVAAGSTKGKTASSDDRDFALARYNTDGSLDASFGSNGKVATNISTLSGIGSTDGAWLCP